MYADTTILTHDHLAAMSHAELVAVCNAILAAHGGQHARNLAGSELSTINSAMLWLTVDNRPGFVFGPVAGFRQWIDAGRVVRKGERATTIYFPRFKQTGSKKSDTDDNADNADDAEKTPELSGYGRAAVFLECQTDPAGDKPTSPEECHARRSAHAKIKSKRPGKKTVPKRSALATAATLWRI